VLSIFATKTNAPSCSFGCCHQKGTKMMKKRPSFRYVWHVGYPTTSLRRAVHPSSSTPISGQGGRPIWCFSLHTYGTQNDNRAELLLPLMDKFSLFHECTVPFANTLFTNCLGQKLSFSVFFPGIWGILK
jgi:hypothetical protein